MPTATATLKENIRQLGDFLKRLKTAAEVQRENHNVQVQIFGKNMVVFLADFERQFKILSGIDGLTRTAAQDAAARIQLIARSIRENLKILKTKNLPTDILPMDFAASETLVCIQDVLEALPALFPMRVEWKPVDPKVLFTIKTWATPMFRAAADIMVKTEDDVAGGSGSLYGICQEVKRCVTALLALDSSDPSTYVPKARLLMKEIMKAIEGYEAISSVSALSEHQKQAIGAEFVESVASNATMLKRSIDKL